MWPGCASSIITCTVSPAGFGNNYLVHASPFSPSFTFSVTQCMTVIWLELFRPFSCTITGIPPSMAVFPCFNVACITAHTFLEQHCGMSLFPLPFSMLCVSVLQCVARREPTPYLPSQSLLCCVLRALWFVARMFHHEYLFAWLMSPIPHHEMNQVKDSHENRISSIRNHDTTTRTNGAGNPNGEV